MSVGEDLYGIKRLKNAQVQNNERKEAIGEFIAQINPSNGKAGRNACSCQ
jgi:hypothetical protein